jgi:DnaJ-class molecular chaperone
MNEHEIDDTHLAPGDEAAPGQPGAGENVCPQCNGSGSTSSGVTCPGCEGTGKVVQGIGGG